MFGEISASILVGGALAVVALGFFIRSLFTEEARLRRRRRKNYGPTISRAKGPSVKLAVKTDQPKE